MVPNSEVLTRHEEVTLEECDREPIHVPGLIQPHGILLAVERNGLVRQASANAMTILGQQEVVGRDIADLLVGDVDLDRAIRSTSPVRLGELVLHDQPMDVLAHCTSDDPDGLVIVELIVSDRSGGVDASLAIDELRTLMMSVQSARDDIGLFQAVARQVQRVTGFDRAMIYRFDEELNGSIIAEAISPGKEEELGSFLGLNYPATDIPRQAHRLYLQNWIRLIPDMGYAPVPLIGHEVEGRSKLDLSNALLRSVSPIHIEYLQNMGVSATLTISLPDQRHAESGPERLWGLVACHHYGGPRLMDAARLSVCELIGRQVSSTIAMRRIRQQSDLLAKRRGIQQAVISVTNAALEKSVKLTEALLRDDASILRLVDAAGAAAVGSSGIVSTGSVPSDKALRAIAVHARSKVAAAVGDDAIFVTDRLTLEEPSLADEEEVRQLASGVLAMPLSTDGTLLVWVRPEQVHTVNWGGDPNNKATRDIEGRLSPRKSFDRWQEEVRGRSEPWSPEDVASVRELRRALVDIVVRHFEDLTSLNEQLEVSNSELTRFAYAAGHDLREPIRGINSLASFTLEDFGEQLDSEVLDRLKTIQKLTVRTDGLMSSLLRYAKLGQSRLRRASFSYREVVSEVVETLDVRIRETNATVQVADVLPNIRADRERVYEVVQNLVVNAMKYVSDVDPIIEIGRVKRAAAIAAADTDSARAEANAVGGRHVFFVRDNGIGIPVAQREDVFRIFRRLHSRDAFGGGSGAGLTISKQAVERHGGRMWITGRPDGEQGTTVWFTLEG